MTTLTEQEWIISEDEYQNHEVPEVLAMEALELGATAWQDQGTQKWSMAVDHKVMIPGGVSVEMDAKIEGAIPHSKTLVVVFPIPPYDLEDSATVGVSRGVQWWIPGTPLKIKVDNRTRFPETFLGGQLWLKLLL